jgi:hypothetical protein
MDFSIDHAELVSRLTALWAMLNPSGALSAILNIGCGVILYFIFRQLAAEERSSDDA